jgi:hypothetical protein
MSEYLRDVLMPHGLRTASITTTSRIYSPLTFFLITLLSFAVKEQGPGNLRLIRPPYSSSPRYVNIKSLVESLGLFERNKVPLELKILGLALYIQLSSLRRAARALSEVHRVSKTAV